MWLKIRLSMTAENHLFTHFSNRFTKPVRIKYQRTKKNIFTSIHQNAQNKGLKNDVPKLYELKLTLLKVIKMA